MVAGPANGAAPRRLARRRPCCFAPGNCWSEWNFLARTPKRPRHLSWIADWTFANFPVHTHATNNPKGEMKNPPSGSVHSEWLHWTGGWSDGWPWTVWFLTGEQLDDRLWTVWFPTGGRFDVRSWTAAGWSADQSLLAGA